MKLDDDARHIIEHQKLRNLMKGLARRDRHEPFVEPSKTYKIMEKYRKDPMLFNSKPKEFYDRKKSNSRDRRDHRYGSSRSRER